MSKKTLLIILAFVIVGILVYAGYRKKPASEQQNNQSQKQTTPTQSAAAIPTQKEQKIQESTDKMTINVSYPVLSGTTNSSVQTTVNSELKSYAENLVADFKKSVQDNSYPVEGVKSTLDVSCAVQGLTQNIASFKFANSAFIEGSAHPANEIHGLSYDLTNGQKIALTDVFDTSKDYLVPLSKLAIQNLKAEAPKDSLFDDDMLSRALAPKAENFSDFALTDDSMIIFPAPYSVAPAASGPQTIEIPFSELGDYFSPTFARLIGK